MRKPLLVACLFAVCAVNAQVPLDTFVGQATKPADDAPICEIPIYPEVTTDLPEPLETQLVHDFKLYTLEGDSVQLSGVLNDGKPVLLIGCNYTCYVFRGKIDVINEMKAMYGDLINIYLIYTVEAHPIIDFSPYFGYENVGADNYAEGILYRQPTTYGERKEIVSDMLENEDIHVPVLIDGPCNEVWTNYGTNPNPAWLIAPDGTVFDAQKWYNKAPENMYTSIDSILNIVGTGTYVPQGTFDAVDEGEAIYYGTVDNTIAAHITFTNSSDDDVLIDFVRVAEDVPAGWFTAMCTDLCYSPNTDSTTVYLPAGATEIVRIDFFTDTIPSTGTVEISCKNHYDETNAFSFTFYAQSVAEATDVELINPNSLVLYPNPAVAANNITLNYLPQSGDAHYQLVAMNGNLLQKEMMANTQSHTIETAGLASGTYIVTILDGDQVHKTKLVILE